MSLLLQYAIAQGTAEPRWQYKSCMDLFFLDALLRLPLNLLFQVNIVFNSKSSSKQSLETCIG